MILQIMILALVAQIHCEEVVEKYYWRDFEGTIPKDAVPGGTDENGRDTYIGTTFFPAYQAVLPTTIYQNDSFVYSHLGDFYLKSVINTKILCAPDETRPVWMNVQFDRLKKCECDYIKGGYQNTATLLIGRSKVGNRYLTGKVYPMDNAYYGLEIWTVAHRGHILNFELLGYCKLDNGIEDQDKKINIDI